MHRFLSEKSRILDAKKSLHLFIQMQTQYNQA